MTPNWQRHLHSEWAGARVMVTGGGRGIGRALCIIWTDLGADVLTVARTSRDLDETATLCKGPGTLHCAVVDVTAVDEVEQFFSEAPHQHRGLDCLVNNAAVLGPRTQLENVTFDAWKQTVHTNIDSVFLVSTAALPHLRNGRKNLHGVRSIINLSSSVGRKGRATWGPYAVSKFGVEGLTEVLADELRSEGIVSVSMNPGGTATPMRSAAYPDEDPNTLPTALQVARSIVLLADRLRLDESGNKYNARDIMPLVHGDKVDGPFPSLS
jgi:NAD(P)-dependent dehydrogenase (short-subunit alcohol dehydrogenase family)